MFGWSKRIFTWVIKLDNRIVDIILIASFFTMQRRIVCESAAVYNARSSLSTTGVKFRVNVNEIRISEPVYFNF
jgi:hypothetical protein